MKRMLRILKYFDEKHIKDQNYRISIISHCLNCIGLTCMNPEGKEEAVKLKAVDIVKRFIEYDND